MPVVTLKLGPTLNANNIKEGDDVYFECHILANPKPYKMAWFHNVSAPPLRIVGNCSATRFQFTTPTLSSAT